MKFSRSLVIMLSVLILAGSAKHAAAEPAEDQGKLRIICFGAHPDDMEFKAGGTAAKWARAGHHVKLVSVTNGDIGHWRMAGGPLARRRTREVQEASEVLGTTAEVLDIHDGELMPTLENRKKLVRLIRDWKADIVITHRPWDYHPDHRYLGILVQDAAYMVTVPYFCPDSPPLQTNPVFLYCRDGFQKPIPFQADIIVPIDDVFEQKLRAVDKLVSQVYEGGANGSEERMSRVPPASKPKQRLEWLRERWSTRQESVMRRYIQAAIDTYGTEAAREIKYAEAFEICEYGRRPNREEVRRLFPFLPAWADR